MGDNKFERQSCLGSPFPGGSLGTRALRSEGRSQRLVASTYLLPTIPPSLAIVWPTI